MIRIEEVFVLGKIAIGLCFIAYGGWLVAVAAFEWLKTGIWYLVSIAEYFQIPSQMTTWVGLQTILEWTVSLPLALGSAIVGIGFIFAAFDD